MQAVVYHPKVQWAMTNLGIRRWRTIRRWPPLLLANMFAGEITDHMHGIWQHDLVGAAFGITFIVGALSTDAYLTRRAVRLVGVRSRLVYLMMAAGPLSLAVVSFYLGVRLYGNHVWLSDACTLIRGLSGWTALLALGRAVTWGRLRGLWWVYPPTGRPPG